MQGYVVRKGNQHYAVIYEGLDPISGRERRRWNSAGPDPIRWDPDTQICWTEPP